MRDVFVVTHTQSRHQVEETVGGWYDTELTEKGRADAMRVADALANRLEGRTATLFSSDLMRAAETADIIGRRVGAKPQLLSDLREMSYGEAGGKPQAWLKQREQAAPDDNRLHFRPDVPGAESRFEFASRVYRALDAILAEPCQTQIVVTHGFALTFVISAWIGMPIDAVGYVNFAAAPGGITHLREDDYWKNRGVLQLNDTSHLG